VRRKSSFTCRSPESRSHTLSASLRLPPAIAERQASAALFSSSAGSPNACSSCFFVSPSAPFAVIPRAYSTETGESRRVSPAPVFCSSRTPKSVIAAASASVSVPASGASVLTPAVSSEAVTAAAFCTQPESGAASSAAVSSRANIFFIKIRFLSVLPSMGKDEKYPCGLQPSAIFENGQVTQFDMQNFC